MFHTKLLYKILLKIVVKYDYTSGTILALLQTIRPYKKKKRLWFSKIPISCLIYPIFKHNQIASRL